MSDNLLNGRDFLPELTFSASRSSGPGGQHVNKVSTKVELRFRVMDSILLSEEEKELVIEKLAGRINKEGEIVLTSQRERTQLRNKEVVLEKFYILLTRALSRRKRRKPTKPSMAMKELRLKEKRDQAKKKESRGNICFDV